MALGHFTVDVGDIPPAPCQICLGGAKSTTDLDGLILIYIHIYVATSSAPN
jgi:hypothetical protein